MSEARAFDTHKNFKRLVETLVLVLLLTLTSGCDEEEKGFAHVCRT